MLAQAEDDLDDTLPSQVRRRLRFTGAHGRLFPLRSERDAIWAGEQPSGNSLKAEWESSICLVDLP